MSDEITESGAAWSDEIVYLAEIFHDIYEAEAQRFGWQSQTPVPFSELPEANKQTMLCTVERVLGQMVAYRDAYKDEQITRCEHDFRWREIDLLIGGPVGWCPACGEPRHEGPPYSPREQRLIDSYNAKVEEFAKETLRASELVAEIER